MEDGFSIELRACFGLVRWRMNRASAYRPAGTLFRDVSKTSLFAAEPLHHAHHAAMFAVPAAAWRKVQVGVGGKKRRNQRPTEQHHQRKCDHAPHSKIIT
jgi:hypothetical protein